MKEKDQIKNLIEEKKANLNKLVLTRKQLKGQLDTIQVLLGQVQLDIAKEQGAIEALENIK